MTAAPIPLIDRFARRRGFALAASLGVACAAGAYALDGPPGPAPGPTSSSAAAPSLQQAPAPAGDASAPKAVPAVTPPTPAPQPLSPAWISFATTVAVFLWLVYARIPVLEGSVLGLVAVSTLSSGASLIIENGSDKKNTAFSRGFFYDVMTDTDGVQQAHRYQALVVNLLLFAVGLLYVLQHLAYPTFDTSWLELLGISGLAQAAGKGTLEQK